MSKDLVKKWKPTGLLDNFNGVYPSSKELREAREKQTNKEILAEALEECANLMLKENVLQTGLVDFHGMALPLVRRIYDEGNGLKAEYHKMKEIYNELKDDFMPKNRHSNVIDLEAELCALVGETYVERYGETNEGECDDKAE